PIFPPELEREIFEIAATIDPKSIRTLLLVAKRTLEWQPLRYRIVRIKDSTHLPGIFRAVEEKPLVLRHGVRLLFVAHTHFLKSDPVCKLLAICTKIEDIAILKSDACPELLPLLAAMPQLRRFTGALCPLFVPAQRLISDGGGSFLRNLTHMDIFDHPSSVMSIIMALPSLTHLSFS
ncbi:hypothetical protein C8F01DRAFT_931588, partial [Mycena amicta]